MGGMIGETTLAMLYVPLFFYIFDRLAERSKANKKRNFRLTSRSSRLNRAWIKRMCDYEDPGHQVGIG